MIVVDSSAVMAMILEEADSFKYREAIIREPTILISAGTVLELDVVTLRRGRSELRALMEELTIAAGFIVVPVGGKSLTHARRGFEKFGKGRGEAPAALNYGDCFSYGLSKAEQAPLLFKGDDFSKTDVQVYQW